MEAFYVFQHPRNMYQVIFFPLLGGNGGLGESEGVRGVSARRGRFCCVLVSPWCNFLSPSCEGLTI